MSERKIEYKSNFLGTRKKNMQKYDLINSNANMFWNLFGQNGKRSCMNSPLPQNYLFHDFCLALHVYSHLLTRQRHRRKYEEKKYLIVKTRFHRTNQDMLGHNQSHFFSHAYPYNWWKFWAITVYCCFCELVYLLLRNWFIKLSTFHWNSFDRKLHPHINRF